MNIFNFFIKKKTEEKINYACSFCCKNEDKPEYFLKSVVFIDSQSLPVSMCGSCIDGFVVFSTNYNYIKK